mmetsp:Transcript_41474/g.119588  ORF Transcript_41474/g.119588 Transcript_41474/m.119588 type:complete len:218 (+) Transcript_41474:77-730(+)
MVSVRVNELCMRLTRSILVGVPTAVFGVLFHDVVDPNVVDEPRVAGLLLILEELHIHPPLVRLQLLVRQFVEVQLRVDLNSCLCFPIACFGFGICRGGSKRRRCLGDLLLFRCSLNGPFGHFGGLSCGGGTASVAGVRAMRGSGALLVLVVVRLRGHCGGSCGRLPGLVLRQSPLLAQPRHHRNQLFEGHLGEQRLVLLLYLLGYLLSCVRGVHSRT